MGTDQPEGTSPAAYADNVVASYQFRVTVRGESDPGVTVETLDEAIAHAVEGYTLPGCTVTVRGERLDR